VEKAGQLKEEQQRSEHGKQYTGIHIRTFERWNLTECAQTDFAVSNPNINRLLARTVQVSLFECKASRTKSSKRNIPSSLLFVFSSSSVCLQYRPFILKFSHNQLSQLSAVRHAQNNRSESDAQAEK
jgi:hypothetical protein